MLFLRTAVLICGTGEDFSRVMFPYCGVSVHLVGQEFRIKQIPQARAEPWLVLEAFSAFRRIRDRSCRTGDWLFHCLLSLCAVDSGHSISSFDCPNHGFAIKIIPRRLLEIKTTTVKEE